MKLASPFRATLFVSFVLLLAACDGGSGGASIDYQDQGTPLVFEADDFQSLTSTEVDTLLFVREEEKLARDVYLTLYDTWQKQTFQNIATKSEQQHMDAVKVLLDGYSLDDPITSDEIGAFTDPYILSLYEELVARGELSLEEGLQVGAYIEEYDLDDLNNAVVEAQSGSNPYPVIETYTRLLCGSRNHLRAFVKQIELDGVTYQAQLLSQEAVDLVVDSDQEQCD